MSISQKGFANFNTAGTGRKGITARILKEQQTVKTKGGGATSVSLGGGTRKPGKKLK
jgi:hypothetical protein